MCHFLKICNKVNLWGKPRYKNGCLCTYLGGLYNPISDTWHGDMSCTATAADISDLTDIKWYLLQHILYKKLRCSVIKMSMFICCNFFRVRWYKESLVRIFSTICSQSKRPKEGENMYAANQNCRKKVIICMQTIRTAERSWVQQYMYE